MQIKKYIFTVNHQSRPTETQECHNCPLGTNTSLKMSITEIKDKMFVQIRIPQSVLGGGFAPLSIKWKFA